jgi:rare lipoprotein A
MTAAHLNLPFNTKVKVTNLYNKKSIVVRINDRGPFINKRIIDLSRAAADSLGFIYNGLTKVQLTILSYGKPQTYLASANILKKSALTKENSNEHLSIIPFETAMPFEEETSSIATDNTIATKDTFSLAANQNSTANLIEVKTTEIINPLVMKDTLVAEIVKSNESSVLVVVKPQETANPSVVQDTLSVQNIKTLTIASLSNEEITAMAVSLPKADTLTAATEIADKNMNTASLSFGLQIGSFKQKDNAYKLYAKMKLTYQEINIEEIKKENAVFYRLIIGKFADEKQAINLKEKLKSVFPASFIVHH